MFRSPGRQRFQLWALGFSVQGFHSVVGAVLHPAIFQLLAMADSIGLYGSTLVSRCGHLPMEVRFDSGIAARRCFERLTGVRVVGAVHRSAVPIRGDAANDSAIDALRVVA